MTLRTVAWITLGLALGLAISAATWLNAQAEYALTTPGTLKGKLTVQWLAADQFLFTPDAADPLTFTRHDGTVIKPAKMFTDGGTTPQALRALKSYSPWGYAPAFIVHDWLFTMQHCKIPGYETYDLNAAASVLAEVMKTMMEDPRFGPPNRLLHYSFYQGVKTSKAKEYWNTGTSKTPEGAKSEAGPASAREGARMATPPPASIATYTIEF